jgi:hypothetical protein
MKSPPTRICRGLGLAFFSLCPSAWKGYAAPPEPVLTFQITLAKLGY